MWLLVGGIILIVVGLFAIGAPLLTGIGAMIAIGILLLIGSGAEVVSAAWARCWGGFFGHVLTGILYLILGIFILDNPGRALVGITLFIAIALIVGGLFRIVLSVTNHFHSWGWVLLSGIISLILGVMIWKQLPESSLWVVGLFVGIEMLFSGWSWVMLALAARAFPAGPTQAPPTLPPA
jgi:uncharacterized membrane protein HdeD (DUF308 family)